MITDRFVKTDGKTNFININVKLENNVKTLMWCEQLLGCVFKDVLCQPAQGIGISNWSKVDERHLHRNGIYLDAVLSAMIMRK